MVQLQLLVFTLIFNNFMVHLDAKNCPKGKRVSRKSGKCEDCPEGYFQQVETRSQECNACTNCDANSGSRIKHKCTKVSNTECECRDNFSFLDEDFSTCVCHAGFGLNREACSPCPSGSYSTEANSNCRRWKECKWGVKVSGSVTSDVLCSDNDTTSSSPPREERITVAPSEAPHLSTPRILTRSPTPPRQVTLKGDEASSSTTHIGVSLVVSAVVICLLFLFAAVWCKRRRSNRKVQVEPLCRQPVEESGDDSSSSQKMNPEEV